MFHLNNVLLDIALPPDLTESPAVTGTSTITDPAGNIVIIIMLAVVAAAVIAALALLLRAAAKKKKKQEKA